MSDKPERFIDDEGLRLDGRRVDEIRPMKVEMGVLSRADGSCYLEWGNNKVLAAVYGPRELHPRRMQKPNEVLVRYKYNMASFSVEDRIRPGPSRRSTEISKVSGEAFEPVVMTQYYPGAVIDVFAEVLQADAGTRTAAINAATLALADAGIPMKGLVSACAVGKVDGQLVLDLNKPEDNYGQADLPVAMTQDGEITLLQMDGHLTPEELEEGLEMVKKGCQQILEIQREALVSRYGNEDEEGEEAEEESPEEVPEPEEEEDEDEERDNSFDNEESEAENSDENDVTEEDEGEEDERQ
jgi:exosome complex component RRP41